jgi:bidirectional [NiFe] hydrogenase diaphorase subunit
MAAGAESVLSALRGRLAASGMATEPDLVGTGCRGPCSRGPLLTVQRRDETDVIFEHATPELAIAVVDALSRGADLPGEGRLPEQFPFLTCQTRIVLANCGRIDPEEMGQYIGAGGYGALARVLHDMTPEEVCAAVSASGLRGRGGAGYPTGLKWQLVRKERRDRKFVIANGDEGDPGAYMDRALMEADPHRILEGMAIAGYAVGAEEGYIYVRGEYPLAAKRLHKAVADAEQAGILGSHVLGSHFRFRIFLRMGAGAFVCGEETALLASVMGQRGEPRSRPPYPSRQGLWGCPTLINNVETFANIPAIISMGVEAFAAVGTPASSGTKVFALCGELVNTGLIEVPLGTPLRRIVHEIGGGLPDGRTFKAAQTGGPSGGCIPAARLDIPLDYEELQALGSIMGSGGLIVMGEESCMIDIARYFMGFCMDESCGKCVPCRAGTGELFRMLDLIAAGIAHPGILEDLEQLCRMMRETALCGLGMSAPNPVLSTLRWFRGEYETHLRERRCPAGRCAMGGEAGPCPS